MRPPGRRDLLLPLGAVLLAAPRLLRAETGLWFDPTQLPSFSGRVDRWVMNPAGEVDRGLFKEGAQFVFAPSEAGALQAAIPHGEPLTVWGIRARTAPVITMLAWGRSEAEPNFVERPTWIMPRAVGRIALTLSGRIQGPLLTPQGEAMGVILAEGGAIRLLVAVHRALAERLAAGAPVTAEGFGTRRDEMVALDARRLGRDAASLADLPEPA